MTATHPDQRGDAEVVISALLASRRQDPSLPARSDRVTPDAAARLPRQSLAQTRTDLLEAGVLIVNEYVSGVLRDSDPPVDLLPFIRLGEVLEIASELARKRLEDEGGLRPDERVAPLTAGAFYKAFAADYHDAGRGGALTAYHRLVTRKIVDEHMVTDAETYIALGKSLAGQGHSWGEIVRLGIALEFQRWTSTPAIVLYTALTLHTGADKAVRNWTRKVYEDELEQLLRIYEVLLKLYRRRMRPGISAENMAIAISDLVSGMTVNTRIMPDNRNVTLNVDIDGMGHKDWHLCALAAWGIYNMFTEPDESQ